ncbi:ATP-binding cassette domain-containing protein [Shigella sonnei]
MLAGTTPRREIQDDTRMMFQDARLLPWKSVIDNVGLGLRPVARCGASGSGCGRTGVSARGRPAGLSGGQKQRVALARALITSTRFIVA